MSAESLDALAQAIQDHVNDMSDEAWMVDNAIVGFELVGLNDDGDARRKIMYVIPTDNFTLSGSLGLLDALQVYVRHDALGDPRDQDDR